MTDNNEKMIAELNRVGLGMADAYRRIAGAEKQIDDVVSGVTEKLAGPIAERETALADLHKLDAEYGMIVRGRKPDPHAAPTVEEGARWHGMSREAYELLAIMSRKVNAAG